MRQRLHLLQTSVVADTYDGYLTFQVLEMIPATPKAMIYPRLLDEDI